MLTNNTTAITSINILIIGGGAMGRSLYDGWINSAWDQDKIAIFDRNPARSIGDAKRIAQDTRNPKLMIIAVKPQYACTTIKSYQDKLKKTDVVVSVAAGINLTKLRRFTNNAIPVFRVMPNIAVATRKGAMAICTDSTVDQSTIDIVLSTFSKLGDCVNVNESQIDAFTALAGSGPAFVFQFVESLAQAGIKIGLDSDTAFRVAKQTVIGAASLMSETKKTPHSLRQAVTSRNGTTAAGLDVLNENRNFQRLINKTLRSAKDRSSEIAKSQL